MNDTWVIRFLRTVSHFLTFFLFIAFVITCCLLLFSTAMSHALGIELTDVNLRFAARLTFINVVFLSLLTAIADAVRRHFMIHRPVKRMTESMEKVINGDLSVRMEKSPVTDIATGLPTIADQINRMIQELSKMETFRTDFIANVSHELKSPLAVMQNYGTLLQQKDLPEEKRLEYAKVITDSCRSLAGMVTNILKLSKLENQTIYPDAREYDLGEQLCECLLGFEDAWEKKELEIETDLEEGVCVNADPELLSLA